MKTITIKRPQHSSLPMVAFCESVMDTKKYNLRPCPFCGGTNIKPREGLEWSDVTCMDCRQSVSSFPYASEGIWNTRPIEDAFQARIAELELILAADKLIEDGWIGRIETGDKRIAELEAENAKLEKLNSAALEQLSKYACPSDHNNYGQPCNDSDDCVACWREYLGGKDE